MATLNLFFGPHIDGRMDDVKVGRGLYRKVGTGSFEVLAEYHMKFNGRADSAFYKGPVNIEVILNDQIPDATSGPCVIKFNDLSDLVAKYSLDGKRKYFCIDTELNKGEIKISQGRGGTIIEGVDMLRRTNILITPRKA